jgi:hypothetical protein
MDGKKGGGQSNYSVCPMNGIRTQVETSEEHAPNQALRPNLL